MSSVKPITAVKYDTIKQLLFLRNNSARESHTFYAKSNEDKVMKDRLFWHVLMLKNYIRKLFGLKFSLR